jgi:hypothetical protein
MGVGTASRASRWQEGGGREPVRLADHSLARGSPDVVAGQARADELRDPRRGPRQPPGCRRRPQAASPGPRLAASRTNDRHRLGGWAQRALRGDRLPGPRVESFLSGLRLRRNLEITAIRNEAWEAGNASSLLAARHVIDEDFVLLVADHVFDPAILRRLLGQHLEEGEIVLAVDFRVDDNALVDVEDATKVAVRGRWVAAVGKELREHDAFDTGIFLCSPAILPAFESASARETTRSPAGCGG